MWRRCWHRKPVPQQRPARIFSLTPDGRLTAKNADISGSVNANAGTLN
ncbi:TPA: hypothetical protein ACP4W0_004714, partial [Escherichia coli]